MTDLCGHSNALPRNRMPSDCPWEHIHSLLNQNARATVLELEIEDNHPDFAELKRIEESGCVFAGFLRNCIRTKLDSFIKESTSEIGVISIRKISYLRQRNNAFHISTGSCNGLRYLVVTMDIQVQQSSSRECFITFDVFADENGLPARCLKILRRPIDPDALSDNNKLKITKWIADCIEGHEKCRKNTAPYLPTRLIDVECGPERCRLIHSKSDILDIDGYDPLVRYIALSYCWGRPTEGFLKTERQTLKERCDFILIDDMPLAFKDLVRLSLELGVRYIWIDALCIIQDDENDWKTEAAAMKNVYSNAYLTVAASSIQSPHEGFLYRHLENQLKIPFPNDEETETSSFYWIRPSPDPLTQEPFDTPDFYRDVHTTKWVERGWTWQEELLSTRILYFGRTQMHFQCRTFGFCENSSISIRPTLFPWPHTSIGSLLDWYAVIIHYTIRELSNPYDKLPAIAGIADTLNTINDDRYLGGLFFSDLPCGLLWMSIPYNRTLIRTVTRAPSWSWAANDGSIVWYSSLHGLRTLSQCYIVDAQTTTVNFMGRPVTYGFIELSGKIIGIKAAQKSKGLPLQLFHNDNAFAEGLFDLRSTYDGLEQGNSNTFQALVIARFFNEDGTLPEFYAAGIIVRARLDWDGNDSYERVGLFMINSEKSMLEFGMAEFQKVRII